jgi:hypothetical protein
MLYIERHLNSFALYIERHTTYVYSFALYIERQIYTVSRCILSVICIRSIQVHTIYSAYISSFALYSSFIYIYYISTRIILFTIIIHTVLFTIIDQGGPQSLFSIRA